MSDQPTLQSSGDIVLVEYSWQSDRLVELILDSDALWEPVAVRVLLPTNYRHSTERRYPTLYLLHGGLGSYRDWTDSGGIEALTALRDWIIVMPDGGRGGWYRDWHNFGRGGAPKWETFHIHQLLPYIDDQFATHADRSARAIAGLSMGGHGALSYAGRHPDLFCAALAFSAALDTQFPLLHALIQISPRIHYRMPFTINAPKRSDWQAHNPVALAEHLRDMHITITTGNGRPTRLAIGSDQRPKDLQEHQVRAMSFKMHRALNDLGINHAFRDYGNIGHIWENWHRAMADSLDDIEASFAPTR